MTINKLATYCRWCGHEVVKHVEATAADMTIAYTCECRKGRLLPPSEVMQGSTLDARIKQLESMQTMMQNANDENIYSMWITNGIPDGANWVDLLYIALEDTAYKECFDLFVRLIARKGNRWRHAQNL